MFHTSGSLPAFFFLSNTESLPQQHCGDMIKHLYTTTITIGHTEESQRLMSVLETHENTGSVWVGPRVRMRRS